MQEKKLTFVEGASSKFWNATQDGTRLTVVYGRISTSGQTQEKTFASDGEAASAFSKQVAEKLKKGYVESEGEGPSQPPSPKPELPLPNPSPKGKGLPEVGSVAVEPAVLDLNPPRQIKLTDRDRLRVGATPLPEPQPRPAPEPFDKEKCLERLARIGKKDQFSYQWKWEQAKLTINMTQEEAAFWGHVILSGYGSSISLEKVLTKARGLTSSATIPVGLDQLKNFHQPILIVPAFVTHGVEGIAALMVDLHAHYQVLLLTALESEVLPYLNPDERERLTATLIGRLTLTQQELWVLRLLTLFGFDADALETQVARWSDGSAKPQYFGGYYGNHGNEYLRVLPGLRDPVKIAREARRLEALPTSPDDIRLLLATTEFRCLDLIARSVLGHTTKAEAESQIKAFALAEAPEVAPYMLDLLLESKAPGVARQWLDEHPVFATEGLLPIAAGQGKKADAALAYLRGLKKRELGYVIEAKLEGQPESIVAAIRERVLEREEVVYEPITENESPEWVKIVFGGELTVPDAPADENPERRLNISEADARSATLPPLPEYRPIPSAPPFDIDACIARLLPLKNSYHWELHKLPLTLPMSHEEAHFWLEANFKAREGSGPGAISAQMLESHLRAQNFGKNIKKQRLTKNINLAMMVPLFVLFGTETLFDVIFAQNQAKDFGKLLLPHVTEEQRAELRAKIPEELQKRIGHYQIVGLFDLMEQLHCTPEEFDVALAKVGKHENAWWGKQFFSYLFRLKTPEAMAAMAKRMSAYPETEAHGRKWLAATGWLGVPCLSKMLDWSYYDKAEAAKILALVEAPEVARHLLALRRFSSSKVIARGWLDRFPAFAIEGLAPLLVEKDKKQVELATDYLRELKRKGYGWLIAKKLAGFDEKIQAEGKKRVLDYDPRKDKAPVASDTALAALLPPVLVKTENGPRRLTAQQQAMLLAELRTTPITEPSPSLEQVKQNAEKRALDAFAWALFESWQSDGAPSKERWKMEALGHLGSDSVALKLTPLVRQWPGESQHQRAVLGLDCLRAIGTDTALMQINGIAEKVSFKGIKERAKECMEAIAADRSLTRDELSDRIIPDGGLDSRGSRVFDFGTRQFTFLLSTELKPMVRGDDGKRLPDLPKPNTKDDAEKAAEAIAAWKLLKKQVGEIAKSQAVRLEQAMVLGRRWTPSEFNQLFGAHPVMVHLVRRLIWCAYDETNQPLAAFRVADDSTLADETDALWELPESAATVGIVHPAHLTTAQQGAWGEIFADYELIPPFVQLGRPIYTLTDEEKPRQYVNRFKGIKIDPKVLIFGLDALGWTRGIPQDGGGFACHHKVFGSAVAVITYEEGVWAGGNGDDWEPQEVTGAGFIADKKDAEDGWFSWDYREASHLSLTAVDSVIVSEVLHDLTRLVEKGRKS